MVSWQFPLVIEGCLKLLTEMSTEALFRVSFGVIAFLGAFSVDARNGYWSPLAGDGSAEGDNAEI